MDIGDVGAVEIAFAKRQTGGQVGHEGAAVEAEAAAKRAGPVQFDIVKLVDEIGPGKVANHTGHDAVGQGEVDADIGAEQPTGGGFAVERVGQLTAGMADESSD